MILLCGKSTVLFSFGCLNWFRKSPKITLKLRAPIELENLLPYNVQYRIFDRNANTNWKSYLRNGGIMPVHSVQLDHLVLLNVEVQDTGASILQLNPTKS